MSDTYRVSLCQTLTGSHCVRHLQGLTVLDNYRVSLCRDLQGLTVSETYRVSLCQTLTGSHCVRDLQGLTVSETYRVSLRQRLTGSHCVRHLQGLTVSDTYRVSLCQRLTGSHCVRDLQGLTVCSILKWIQTTNLNFIVGYTFPDQFLLYFICKNTDGRYTINVNFTLMKNLTFDSPRQEFSCSDLSYQSFSTCSNGSQRQSINTTHLCTCDDDRTKQLGSILVCIKSS